MLPPSEALSPLNIAPNEVAFLAVPGWERMDWLWHGFSTRVGGVSTVYGGEGEAGELNLGFTAHDSPENVRENRRRFVEAVTGNRDIPLVPLRQVHSCRSVTVGEAVIETVGAAGAVEEADGLMTRKPGILIGIQTADCIPVLVVDPVRRAVGAFHAGWRGTVQRIVERGVARMGEEFGSNPAELLAAIGPGIGACCYAVGDEVRERFAADFSYADALFTRDGADMRLDLTEANRRQLLAAGLRAESVATVGGCTSCQPQLFYSHRASGGRAGRMMAVVGNRAS